MAQRAINERIARKKARQAVDLRSDTLPGKLTRTGLRLPKNLSYGDWQAVGEKLQAVQGSALWWIGDWLNYGEKAYGEKYEEALEKTDYAYQTLMDAKSVAGAFEISRRRENLPYSFHRDVQGLKPDEQDKLLDQK